MIGNKTLPRTSNRKKQRTQDWLIQLIALVCGLIIIIPVLYCLSLSFMRVSEILSRPPKIFPGGLYLGNYETALTKSMIPRFLLNSMIISLICSIVRVLTASLAGFGFAFLDFRGKNLLFYLVLGTMLIPGDVILTSNYFTISQLGLVNTYLGIMLLYFVSANNIFMMRQHFLTVSKTLREAAQIDGAGYARIHFTIVMPVVKPALVTAFIMVFQAFWTNTGANFIYTESQKGFAYVVGQLASGKVAGVGASFVGISSASSVLMFAVPLVVFLIMQNNVVSTMATSGMKE